MWPASASVRALKRTTQVVKHRDGGDPSTSRKSPGRTEFEPITLERGVTHDSAFEAWAAKVWQVGAGLGAEVSLEGFPQGHHPGVLQRGRPTRDQLQDLSRAGCRNIRRCPISTPTPTPSRSSTSCWKTRAGSGIVGDRADGAELHLDPRITAGAACTRGWRCQQRGTSTAIRRTTPLDAQHSRAALLPVPRGGCCPEAMGKAYGMHALTGERLLIAWERGRENAEPGVPAAPGNRSSRETPSSLAGQPLARRVLCSRVAPDHAPGPSRWIRHLPRCGAQLEFSISTRQLEGAVANPDEEASEGGSAGGCGRRPRGSHRRARGRRRAGAQATFLLARTVTRSDSGAEFDSPQPGWAGSLRKPQRIG